MDDEKLIECVRKCEVIYDLFHPEYMDSALKNNIWKTIGEELKTDGPTCKARWNNIRDTYKKTIRKYDTTSGQSAKQIKRYKYSNQLEFVRKYFDDRKTKSNIESPCTQSQEENEGYVTTDLDEESVTEDDLQIQKSPVSAVHGKETPSHIFSKKSDINNKSVKSTHPEITASGRLLDYLVKKNEAQNSSPPHPVDAFLASIAPALKTFSPYNLLG